MKLRVAALVLSGAVLAFPQRGPSTRPVRLASRGTRGAVAAGTEYATEAGMRMFYQGGNAVDAGIATMLAASVTEFSHFGLGGEAPILVRTKDGKVYAIAGVGTMPKLATADFFRNHKLQPDEIVDAAGRQGAEGLGAGGGHSVARWCRAWWRRRWWRCASSAPSRSPKRWSRPSNWPTVSRIDELRALSHRAISAQYLEKWPSSQARLPAQRARCRRPARFSASPTWRARCAPWRRWRRRRWPAGATRAQGHRRGARLLLPRRHRAPHRRILQAERRPAALRRHGGVPRGAGRSRSPPPSTATPFTSPASGARARR